LPSGDASRRPPEEVGVAKYLELRRHTDDADDALSGDGVRQALQIGAELQGNYEVLVSTGAQRATQTLGCFLAALGQKVPGGVVVEVGLRSEMEDRWKAAYREAGSGELQALRSADLELVEQDSATLGSALRRVFDGLSDGGRALAVGHSPTNEAAVLGLTGDVVEPMSKGGGVLVVEENERFRVEPLL
jgi:phosphohistidine phosphatase SixA